jgi:hypothetical protein
VFAQIASRQAGTASEDTWVLGYRGTSTDAGAPYQSAICTVNETATSVRGPGSTGDIGIWVHIAVTYDGAIERLYRDGTEIMTRALTGAIIAGPTRIMVGAADNGAALINEYFTGSIDDLRIYASALCRPKTSRRSRRHEAHCLQRFTS